jgi:tRNA nucleotidyltransferase/poly(A) polymerase
MRAIRQAASLGFSIAPETRKLMKEAAGLLPRISPERIRDELFKILDGPRPSASIRALDMLGLLPHILPELPSMKGVKQTAPHVHDVWDHTLRVLDFLEMIFGVLTPGYDADKTNDLFTGLFTLRIGRYREQFGKHFAKSPEAERTPRSVLMFAALYHDIAKPLTMKIEGSRIRFFEHEQLGTDVAEKRATALRVSGDDIQRIKTVIREHMRIHFHTDRMAEEKKEPTRRAVYRFFQATGDFGVDLCLLAMADQRATYDNTLPQENWVACLDVCRIFLENYWERPQDAVAPPQIINGNDLINDLGMKPGPEIGALLDAIREDQAMGHLSTKEEALFYARGWLANERVRKEKEKKK